MRLHFYLVGFLLLAIGFGAGFGVCRALQFSGTGEKTRRVDLSVQDGGVYRVRSVVDGDTIILENGLHVRYNGINTPEKGHFVREPAPLSGEATARNTQLVEGKMVRLHLPQEPLDMYGRVVARVEVLSENAGSQSGGQDVGEVLIKEGLARAMGLGVGGDDFKHLQDLQNEAKAAHAGIWGLADKPQGEVTAKPFCSAEKSNIYHLSTCSTAKRIQAANRHEYATAKEAESAGLSPCSRCQPR